MTLWHNRSLKICTDIVKCLRNQKPSKKCGVTGLILEIERPLVTGILVFLNCVCFNKHLLEIKKQYNHLHKWRNLLCDILKNILGTRKPVKFLWNYLETSIFDRNICQKHVFHILDKFRTRQFLDFFSEFSLNVTQVKFEKKFEGHRTTFPAIHV